jgi:hypothetical protein
MNRRHGGPYDRGSADAYYRRGANPHYYVGATGLSDRVTDLTDEEKKEYYAGYASVNENDCKDWGHDDDRDDHGDDSEDKEEE